MNVRSANKRFAKNSVHRRDHNGGTTDAGYRDATNIEQASHAVNAINARIKREAHQTEDFARRKVTLSPTLDAWLAKEIP